MAGNVRERQMQALMHMLNLNQHSNASSRVSSNGSATETGLGNDSDLLWKVLIYDKCGQDIISPLFNVGHLRDMGVTLHLQLESNRERVPDVPAVYFVQPSEHNVLRICQDFAADLYESYYVNFISPIPRHLLEQLAAGAIRADCVERICSVYDQYLNFICLEDDLFVLHADEESSSSGGDCTKTSSSNQNEPIRQSISYYALNRTGAKDSEIEQSIEEIVDGLFSFCVTLGQVPIIRCPRDGNAAQLVSERLHKRLSDNLRDPRTNLFSAPPTSLGSGLGSGISTGNSFLQSSMTKMTPLNGAAQFQRPLLVILDRTFDLATPFHHTWTYQALVHDVLSYRLNSVSVPPSGSSTSADSGTDGSSRAGRSTKPVKYDLASATDNFWSKHKGSPFPNVAEAIQEELEAYRNSEEDIRRLKATIGDPTSGENQVPMAAFSTNEFGVAGANVASTAQMLSDKVNALPALLEKKRLIDVHTNVATAVLEQIKRRQLDTYFELEEKLFNGVQLERPLLSIITDDLANEATSYDDKLRLLLIGLLCSGSSGGARKLTSASRTLLSDAEIEKCTAALKEAGSSVGSVDYIRRFMAHCQLREHYAAATGGSSGSISGSSGVAVKTVSMFPKLMSHASQFLMAGVKNLVVRKHQLPLTRILDTLVQTGSGGSSSGSSGSGSGSAYLYLDPKQLGSGAAPASACTAYADAVVFVVGGGNYIEYQNLVDYGRARGVATTAAAGLPDGSAPAAIGSLATAATSPAPFRRLLYGSTQMLNANQFLRQLERLGSEQAVS